MMAIFTVEEIGEYKVNLLWSKMIQMAQDLTTSHERNKGQLGSFIHDHGWGITWRNSSGQLLSHHSVNAIWNDELPSDVKEDVSRSNGFILHIRQASPKLPIQASSCHPFIRESEGFGSVALCHNGTIFNMENIRYNKDKYKPIASSDTELLLYSLLIFQSIVIINIS